jgi:hypothetical protein
VPEAVSGGGRKTCTSFSAKYLYAKHTKGWSWALRGRAYWDALFVKNPAFSGIWLNLYREEPVVGEHLQRHLGADALSVFIRRCVAPIRALIVPNGCSTVSRR